MRKLIPLILLLVATGGRTTRAEDARPTDDALVRTAVISGAAEALATLPSEVTRLHLALMPQGVANPVVEDGLATAATRSGAVVTPRDEGTAGWRLTYSARDVGVIATERNRLFRADELRREVVGLVLIEVTDPAGVVVLAKALPLHGEDDTRGANAADLTSPSVERRVVSPRSRAFAATAAVLFCATLYLALR